MVRLDEVLVRKLPIGLDIERQRASMRGRGKIITIEFVIDEFEVLG